MEMLLSSVQNGVHIESKMNDNLQSRRTSRVSPDQPWPLNGYSLMDLWPQSEPIVIAPEQESVPEQVSAAALLPG